MSLDHLKPRKAGVLVGDRELILRPSNLMQHQAFVGAVGPLMSSLAKDFGPLLKGGDEDTILDAVVNGIPGAVDALGKHAGDLVDAVAAMLDNEDNFKTLANDGVFDSDDAERDGYYVSSERLQRYIKHHITVPQQVVHVVMEASRLNDYAGLGKALTGALRAAGAKTAATATPRPAAAPARAPQAVGPKTAAQPDAEAFAAMGVEA